MLRNKLIVLSALVMVVCLVALGVIYWQRQQLLVVWSEKSSVEGIWLAPGNENLAGQYAQQIVEGYLLEALPAKAGFTQWNMQKVDGGKISVQVPNQIDLGRIFVLQDSETALTAISLSEFWEFVRIPGLIRLTLVDNNGVAGFDLVSEAFITVK